MTTTSSPPTIARSPARRSSEIKLQATGTDGPITLSAGSVVVEAKPDGFAPQKQTAKRQKMRHAEFSNKSHERKSKANRLWVVKSTGKDGDKWTIRTPKSQPSFRIRPDASGFAVSLSFTDEAGRRREPYLCYLSKPEWSVAKQKSLSRFVQMVLGKLEERKTGDGNDIEKIEALIVRVQGIG